MGTINRPLRLIGLVSQGAYNVSDVEMAEHITSTLSHFDIRKNEMRPVCVLNHRLSLDRVLARKIRSRLLATLSRATSPSSICGVPMGILGSHEGIVCGV